MKFRLTLSVDGNINIGVNVPADQSYFEDYTSEKVAAAATEAIDFILNEQYGFILRPFSGNGYQFEQNAGFFFTALDSNSVEFFKFRSTGHTFLRLPEYADNAAADADTNLASKSLYLLTGDRTVYQKP